MRVLVVHHGLLPAPGRAVTGGALRAWHHGEALRAAGHEVHWLGRAPEVPGGFSSPADLARRAAALSPDRVVAVQLEDAPALSILGAPLAVDLYAPRLLEAPFEGRLASEAAAVLRALARGDVFLVSNARQRWHWLGVLALAGADVRDDPTRLVPLVAPEVPPRKHRGEPVLVAGGAAWPWQDPLPALRRVLAFLDRRGEGRVDWYGGAPLLGEIDGAAALPAHPRLRCPGWLPYDALLEAYSGATAAIDWMEPNPERALALGFRHVDYLGAGLPVLTGPDSALAEVLGEAGWVGDAIEEIVSAVLDDPAERRRRSTAARALARERFSRDRCEKPLVDWVAAGTRHPRGVGPLSDAADLAARAAESGARAGAAADALARAEAEVVRKREENARLTAQAQSLVATAERLARALDEVAGFKREAVAVLGGQSDLARRSLAEAEREIGLLRADIEKKNAELVALDEVRARLENDVVNLRREVAEVRRRGLFGRLGSGG